MYPKKDELITRKKILMNQRNVLDIEQTLLSNRISKINDELSIINGLIEFMDDEK